MTYETVTCSVAIADKPLCWRKALAWFYSTRCRAGVCLALAGCTLISAPAQALPTLYDLAGMLGTETQVYQDSGFSAAQLSDQDGGNDDATAFLFFELADFRNLNSFGIYDYSMNSGGDILLGETLEVFKGKASPLTSATLAFDLSAGTVTHKGTNTTANIGSTFGFYLAGPQSTYYSHSLLNPDGFDHLLTFDTSDNSVGALLGSDLVLAWEDLFGGGDGDYDDMVVGITDVTGVTDVRPVPEPSALALVGMGLIVLVARSRRTPISA